MYMAEVAPQEDRTLALTAPEPAATDEAAVAPPDRLPLPAPAEPDAAQVLGPQPALKEQLAPEPAATKRPVPEATAMAIVPAAATAASAGKVKELAIGYHDDSQKVWNGKCWSVGWKPAGEDSKHTDPAVALFADGSEFVCADLLQGELEDKGVVRRQPPKKAPKAKAKSKANPDDIHMLGTHPNPEIGDLYVTFRKDHEKEKFACLLDCNKKQFCQVSSKSAPIEHGLMIIKKLGKYMLDNPEVTERGTY